MRYAFVIQKSAADKTRSGFILIAGKTELPVNGKLIGECASPKPVLFKVHNNFWQPPLKTSQ
jgi:hypothetical protein